MLSEESSVTYPLLAEPRTVRVQYRKVGHLQYISHLDLQRTFSRVLVRAGIPMWYTQGFNPHAKVTFALPLSVGAESECEFIDLRIERDMPAAVVKERLNRHLTPEMAVSKAYLPDTRDSFGDIGWAEYEITIRSAGLGQKDAEDFPAYLTTPPLLMEKKSKSGMRTMDIAGLIKKVDAICVDGTVPGIRLTAVLSATDTDYLNPEMLLRALREKFGILSGDSMEESYRILRTKVFRRDGKTEFH